MFVYTQLSRRMVPVIQPEDNSDAASRKPSYIDRSVNVESRLLDVKPIYYILLSSENDYRQFILKNVIIGL